MEKYLGPSEIWSGGQTGADQGALYAAKKLGIVTRGFIPAGFRTEDGPRPEFGAVFGLKETADCINYKPRTRMNIKYTDATLIIGNIWSKGSFQTMKLCIEHEKPWFGFSSITYKDKSKLKADMDLLKNWLMDYKPEKLNVAGNRESRNPGIFLFTRDLLITTILELRDG